MTNEIIICIYRNELSKNIRKLPLNPTNFSNSIFSVTWKRDECWRLGPTAIGIVSLEAFFIRLIGPFFGISLLCYIKKMLI